MNYLKASAQLRAANQALQASGHVASTRMKLSLGWAFGPHERIVLMFIAPIDSNPQDFQLQVMVDAPSERDREYPAKAFAEHSSIEEVVNWIIDALARP